MKVCLITTLVLLALINISCKEVLSRDNSQPVAGSSSDFGIVADGKVADILVDAKDRNTVLLAARLFSEDIERVTGKKSRVVSNVKSASQVCVIAGTIDDSSLIKELIKSGKIDVSQVKGKWESHLRQVVNNPFKGIKKALVISGSDRRGTAYGLLDISKPMGVSPWYYFADVAVKKSDSIHVDPVGYKYSLCISSCITIVYVAVGRKLLQRMY